MKSEEKKDLREIAENIISYNDTISKGGNICKRKVNVYGKVLKYIFADREWTFEFVGQLIGYSAQGVNYIVNRMDEKAFNCIFINKLCKKLDIDVNYFNSLCNAVKEICE